MILALVAVTIGLSILQKNARNKGAVSLPDQAVRLVCRPVASASTAVVVGIKDFVFGAIYSSRLKAENQRLNRSLENYALYGETVSRLEKEVNSLRVEMDLDKTYQRPKVVGSITGYFPQQNRVTLDIGKNKGVAAGMPAVCAQGLIGTVQTVGVNDCQVLLITSSAMQLGAIATKYDPPAAGLIYGENSSTLLMKFLSPDVPVASGDVIYTSGFSPQIPRGIVIGRVLSAESMPELGSSRARILPAVNVGELREVVILK
ncbi:MAG: hypothetical protein GC165_00035 [Armatimonadetes bacterium]|nr:hypothetical protein [Armatimonadota bacterium]